MIFGELKILTNGVDDGQIKFGLFQRFGLRRLHKLQRNSYFQVAIHCVGDRIRLKLLIGMRANLYHVKRQYNF